MFEGVAVACCQGPDAPACVCGADERVLRAFSRGDQMRPMSDAERAWCLMEIESVEGFSASDYITGTDAELARGVLAAWLDYCRDKGMIG